MHSFQCPWDFNGLSKKFSRLGKSIKMDFVLLKSVFINSISKMPKFLINSNPMTSIPISSYWWRLFVLCVDMSFPFVLPRGLIQSPHSFDLGLIRSCRGYFWPQNSRDQIKETDMNRNRMEDAEFCNQIQISSAQLQLPLPQINFMPWNEPVETVISEKHIPEFVGIRNSFD